MNNGWIKLHRGILENPDSDRGDSGANHLLHVLDDLSRRCLCLFKNVVVSFRIMQEKCVWKAR